MASHSSASAREETSHATETNTLKLNEAATNIISDAIKRRAQSIINDRSIDPQSRAVIRYGLEINDPWLPELVRRVDAGESVIDCLSGSNTSDQRRKDYRIGRSDLPCW